MGWKVARVAGVVLAVSALAAPASAAALVNVTVRGPAGEPVAGASVTIRQAAGYGGAAAATLEPPLLVGTGVTGADGMVSIRLAVAAPSDVYGISADRGGRHASTAVFAADNHWPAPTLVLGDPLPAINLERSAADGAAKSCDAAAYETHVQRMRGAIAQKEAALAALESAIARYARASGLGASDLAGARMQLAAVRQQAPGSLAAERAAMLQHYVLLRVLADNVRAGLEIDRANAAGVATLEPCSNESRAGVEMLPRCPPGWQLAQQAAQASCPRRPTGSGRERS